MENNNSSFNITQDYEIIPPKKGKAYPIPKAEWNYLKDRIRRIGEITNPYHIAGAILLGFSGSAFINLLITDFPDNPDNSVSSKFVICASIAITTLIIGGVSFFFGRKQKKEQTVKSEDVIKQMEIIEERYSSTDNTEDDN